MAKNVDLIAAVAELCETLGQDAPPTEGLNNAQLTKVVANLKDAVAKKEKGEADAADENAAKERAEADEAQKDADEAAEAAEEAAAKRPPFYIADGGSITGRRGLLAPGDEITAADLAVPGGTDGKAELKAFVKSKKVLKG